ncbi:NAD-dependent epimerase [Marmoricola sp. Leaf446]|uniref:DUF1731 domain-containing protein n=1 Tax=Marmoricola sp. Leaf446 TaxID=1736379 RepID=UPI00070165EE|nr:DUF1731 domain-containing protein [Marmoricola sp. Leaf446]KQT89081.1 NAD-dependent epimerase [Marmoricola sp. Leaf446]
MRIVLPGGSGQVGRLLQRSLVDGGHDVVVLGRGAPGNVPGARHVPWDGRTPGPWVAELDGADAVLNLAGRSVSCRYTDQHLRQMMDSRVDSTRAVGRAVAAAARPPAVWLQMSTATIYADRSDEPGNPANDEATGVIGGEERHVPLYWEYSVRIARRWEGAQAELDLPGTRRVALRAAMVMTPDQGGIFDVLSVLARAGAGGAVAGGQQYVSWIHGDDVVRAVDLLLARDDLDGPVNLAAPGPVPQAELMRDLRHAWGTRVGLPATRGMAGLGAWAMRTDPELLLKSRRVVPGRLLEAGFEFAHPAWPGAARDLVRRTTQRPEGTNPVATLRAMARGTGG